MADVEFGDLRDRGDRANIGERQPVPGVHFEMVGPPLGPVPTTITFDMDIVCSLGVKGGITTEFGGEASTNLTAGVKYDGTTWDKVTDLHVDSHVVGPTWTIQPLPSGRIPTAVEPSDHNTKSTQPGAAFLKDGPPPRAPFNSVSLSTF